MTVRLTAASSKAHQLVEALQALKPKRLLGSGCTGAHIAADVDEANAFWYVEDWKDTAALEIELRTDRFSRLLALLETSDEFPALEFRLVSETRGLDYVAEVRKVDSVTDRG